MAKRRGRQVSIDGLVARLSALDQERIAIQQKIANAIRSLGVPSPFSFGQSSPSRRSATAKASGARRKRRTMSAAQRKAVGERMKKYWAARRSAKK